MQTSPARFSASPLPRLCASLLAASLAFAAGLALLPSHAAACGNDVLPAESPELTALKVAKSHLAKGNYTNAATLLRSSFPDIDKAVPGDNSTLTGAIRVLAVAVARSGGLVPPRGSGARMSVEENLEWAITALRRINEHRKNEPWRQTDLAEAMAKLPKYKAEARSMLEALDARDVVATAEGYATLALLRGEGGDAKGRDVAVARCRKMTKKQSKCDVRTS